MVSWYQASERRRSRADLTRRQVRRALLAASASAPSSGSAATAGSTAGRKSRRGGEAAAAAMSPLTGRSLRLSYGHGGAGHGATSAAASSVVPAHSNRNRPPAGSSSSDCGAWVHPASASDDRRMERQERVAVDRLTAHAMQIEVLDLLAGLPATVFAVAQAVGGCPQVTLLHGRSSSGGWDDDAEEGREVGGGRDEFGRKGEWDTDENVTNYYCPSHRNYEHCSNDYIDKEEETADERSERRVGQLQAALRTLTARVGSLTQLVESWDEAKAILSEVVAFPDEDCKRDHRQHEGVRGGKEEEEEEEWDELEREQRALELGQPNGDGGGGGIIVPIPSTNKKRVGTVSSLLQRRRSTPSSGRLGNRSLIGKAYRSTKRGIAKAGSSAVAVRRRSVSASASAAHRRFLTKASYARMLLRHAPLERMHRFKLLTSTVVPPRLVSVVPPPPPPNATAIRWTGDEGAKGEESTQQDDEEQQRTQREAAEEAAQAEEARAKAIAALSGLAKVDHLADRRLAEAERVARARIDAETARQDAAMAAREEQAEQANEEAAAAQANANRASTLLRDLTDGEATIVRDAIYGVGRPDEILATSDTDSVQRQSLHKLQPGVWLNDEVIHYFLLMLARRDAELATRQPGRKRCHFFKSFFITKLLDEAGGYNYKNVKRWSRKVPGKDIFALDKIFFPVNVIHPDLLLARESDPTVNVSGMHWTVAVVHMSEKRIQFYDSMSGSGDRYLEGLMQYLQDEHMAKKGCPLPDADEWELVESTPDTPQQRNGYDCGVFTCMFCDFLSTDCPLTFSQEHITQCRERIALSIMKGVAIE